MKATGQAATAIRRGRWPEATLAAIAALVSSWSVTGLLATQPWIGPTVLLLAVVAVVGGLARTARLPGWGVVGAQVTLTGFALTWLLLPGTHRLGLPTPATLERAVRLWAEGAETIRTETVPAPTTAGLVLIIVAGLALVGLAVDLLAVTGRSPAAAGIPLLVVSTVTASNTGVALHPKYFLATAVAWLVLLAHQGLGSVRNWPSSASASVDVRAAVSGSTRRYNSRARLLGATTAVLAVVMPGFLPHLPPTTIMDGLGRAGSGGTVTFTDTLDLAADLGSRSSTPVLRYRTDETRPGPLKVTASVTYRDGRWHPEGPDAPPGHDGMPVGPLNPAVTTRPWSITVVENGLRAPQLAVPTPMLGLEVGDLEWMPVARTGSVAVADQPETYGASAYRTVGALPDGVGQGPPADLGIPELLELDEASADRIRALTTDVTAGAATQLQMAGQIQNYLRSSAFEYSLTLADPVRGPDGAELDPISSFLETKQGYCVQFATAMVMMARASGIPARIAVGFLPGASDADGTWTVVAADAHAWPELFINGLGWTRYEPTPGTRAGLAPVYYTEADLAGGDDVQTAPQGPEPTPAPADPGMDTGAATSSGDATLAEVAEQVAPTLGWVLVATAALTLVPLAGWWRRTTPLRRARDDAARIEARWHAMTAALSDLGVAAPASTTPRQARAHYAAGLPDDAAAALVRAADRLERARYAPGGAGEGDMADDVRTVLRAARRARPPAARIRAVLVPASGLTQLRETTDRITASWRAATRRLRSLVPRSEP